MIAKRIIVIPFLIWLTGVSLLTFDRYYKVIREKESIAFIRYQYGFPIGDVVRCPLASVDTLRICITPSPHFRHLTCTLGGKEYSLICFCRNSSRHGTKTLRWKAQDYSAFIHKIRELASKEEGERFYYIHGLTTPREFLKTILVCFIIAGGIGFAIYKL